MFSTYILYSSRLDKYYVGYTKDIHNRIKHHLSGLNKFTKAADDWVLKYNEPFMTKAQAIKREKEIKSKKSRQYIETLIENN